MEWSPTSDSAGVTLKPGAVEQTARYSQPQEETRRSVREEDVALVTETPTDTERGTHTRRTPIRTRREQGPDGLLTARVDVMVTLDKMESTERKRMRRKR